MHPLLQNQENKKVLMLRNEAIARGYLVGSGWKEYQKTGRVYGIALPEKIAEAERLPEPNFTPSTKAEAGANDENILFEQAADLIGKETAQKLRNIGLQLCAFAAAHAEKRGIIIADTKSEFGFCDGKLILADIDRRVVHPGFVPFLAGHIVPARVFAAQFR